MITVYNFRDAQNVNEVGTGYFTLSKAKAKV